MRRELQRKVEYGKACKHFGPEPEATPPQLANAIVQHLEGQLRGHRACWRGQGSGASGLLLPLAAVQGCCWQDNGSVQRWTHPAEQLWLSGPLLLLPSVPCRSLCWNPQDEFRFRGMHQLPCHDQACVPVERGLPGAKAVATDDTDVT